MGIAIRQKGTLLWERTLGGLRKGMTQTDAGLCLVAHSNSQAYSGARLPILKKCYLDTRKSIYVREIQSRRS